MNLLFSINRKFVPLWAQCMATILRHGGADRYDLYVLHSDLTRADQDQMNQVLRAVSRYPKLDARERLDLTRHLQTLCTPTHRAELACGAAHAAGEAEATHALRFCLASPMAIARVAAREQGDLYFELTSRSEGLPHSRRRRLTAPTLHERGGIWFVAGQERMPRLGSTSWRMVRLDRLANLATFSESGTVYVHPFAPKASPQSAGGRQG